MDTKTELKDYTLWFDGMIEVNPENLQDLLLNGLEVSKVTVTEITKDVERFNRLSLTKIKTKTELNLEAFDFSWKLPEAYVNLDVEDYLNKLIATKLDESDPKLKERIARFTIELEEFKNRDLFDILRTLIFIIDTLREKDLVWGVGRGSSCASYILFLIGIHSVDPIRFAIPLNEFFKDYKE